MSDASKKLGFSAMTITRAVRQLEQTTFFTTSLYLSQYFS